VQHGKILRIRGKGFPMYNNPHLFGDLYVNIFVEMPEDLTDEQIELVQKMKKIADKNES
jgi:curved DNA-binding protein